jgi:Ca2+-transporting ATPase
VTQESSTSSSGSRLLSWTDGGEKGNEQAVSESKQKLYKSGTESRELVTFDAAGRPMTPSLFQQSSKPIAVEEFGIGPEELNYVVSFDNRDVPSQLLLLNSTKYGGVQGISHLLRTNLLTGISLSKAGTAAADESATAILGISSASGQERQRAVMYKNTGTTGSASNLHHGKSVRNTVFKDTVNPVVDSQMHVRAIAATSTAGTVPVGAERRTLIFGSNLIPPEKPASILSIIWETILDDPILKILIVGATVTLIIGTVTDPAHGWVDGIAILAAVIIVLTVTAGNDYSKDKKFKKLLLMQSDKKAKVIRGGKKDTISSWDLLVGDLVDLNMGDEVPADGIFVSGVRLVIDESPLTGESLPIKKDEKHPFMFAGSVVSEGSGQMLITAVGPRSTGGQIQQLLSQSQGEETVLQAKLRLVAVLVGKIGATAGVATFLGLLIRWGINYQANNMQWSNAELLHLVSYFVTGVTIVVVAVPEGLPLAVTISLAFSMFKMIKDNCFVRHLSAAETMGQATCICTDKTGTLTENRMTVVKVVLDGKLYSGDGSGDPDAQPFKENIFHSYMRTLLAEAIALNSTCFIKYKPKDPLPTFVGSPTEGSMLHFLEKIGCSYEEIRNVVRKVPEAEFSFTSELKRMTTVVECHAKVAFAEDGKRGDLKPMRVHVKGASEIVLAKCRYVIDSTCQDIKQLTSSQMEQISSQVKSMAGDGLRTVVIACKHIDELPMTNPKPSTPRSSHSSLMRPGLENGGAEGQEMVIDREALETDLIFVALFGIKDPLRKEVPGAVRQCQKAGLQIRMVTGDNVLTACKIARECGILSDEYIAMEGPEFRGLSDAERQAILPRLRVLARSSPSDKYIMVSTLKKMGEVVAVTGDGTNDAPALKEADIGFAMGISGTQIAMNASDVVLLDDNFVSLVQAIRWGRNVLDAVRKFLQFQLSINIAAVFCVFVGSVTLGESPITAVQLLWVNLIMDTLGALGLASSNPDKDVLERQPHSRFEPMLTKEMRQFIMLQASYQILTLLSLLYGFTVPLLQAIPGESFSMSNLPKGEVDRIHTMVFTTFVFTQVTNEVMARQLKHELWIFDRFFDNRIFVINIFLIMVIQTIAVIFGQEFVGTTTISPTEWGICIGIALGNIPWMVFWRLCLRIFKKVEVRQYRRIKDNDKVRRTCVDVKMLL